MPEIQEVKAETAPPPEIKPEPVDMRALVARGPADMEQARGDLEDLTRSKIRETDAITRQTERRGEENRTISRAAFNAEGVTPDKLQPWDADKQKEKYSTSPLEAFGSYASLFGILASAFTHAPMENALNASAGAMNAIRAGDEKAYDQAHTAWKDNMDLVKKRFDMQHTIYQDAISLQKEDAALGTAKLQNALVRFDDRKGLALLEAGMNKELYDYLEHQQKAYRGVIDTADKIDDSAMRKQAFTSLEAQHNPNKDPVRTVTNWDFAHGIREPWQQQLMNEFRLKHQDDPDFLNKAVEYAQKIRSAEIGGRAGVETKGRLDAQWVKKKTAEYVAQGMSETDAYAKANKEMLDNNATITGNRRYDIETHINQFGEGMKLVDNITSVLDRYTGSAGLAGKATRLGERLSNIAGSHQTDRVQMMRDIEELQLLAPRLLLDQSTGRPLSVEAGHINQVIAGLSAGDTTDNTLRAMKEIRDRFQRMQSAARDRLGGSARPAESGAPAAKPDDTDWLNQYPKK